jgi:putative transposase
MDGIIRISDCERKTVLRLIQRGHADHRVVRRAHVLLLLAEDTTVRTIAAMLFCSFDLITAVRREYMRGGMEAALGTERVVQRVPGWWAWLLCWVTKRTPWDFDISRSRWSCETLAKVIRQKVGVHLGRESVRVILLQLGMVWRRPRPVIGPFDPEHDAKMQEIHQLRATLPADQVVVYQDEVQVDLNPKIGSQWMLEGVQAQVVTPGDNERRHLAVSMLAGSGRLIVSRPTRRRNSEQFIAHLEDLCRRLRRWKVIHVICDNANFHKSRAVKAWVASQGGRVVLHYLPTRAPEENPVERVFWRLHEAITRNHSFKTIDELVSASMKWLEEEGAGCTPIVDYSMAA